MVHGASSGHPGGSLGCTEYLVVLYNEIMKRKPGWDMDGVGEDIFFLSNGHISPVFYSVLSRAGYFPVEEMATFRKMDSRLQGHPSTHAGLPGVRIASGSLGQGMSVAIGAAEAKKLNGDDRLVFSLHGDGEMQEGQNWEAIMYAGSRGIDNLVATIDRNGQQIDGPTETVMPLGDMAEKLSVFGWDVIEETEGNDLRKVFETLTEAVSRTGKGKPVGIVMSTVMGHGVDFMMHTHAWHGKAPDDDQLETALAQNPETLGDY